MDVSLDQGGLAGAKLTDHQDLEQKLFAGDGTGIAAAACKKIGLFVLQDSLQDVLVLNT